FASLSAQPDAKRAIFGVVNRADKPAFTIWRRWVPVAGGPILPSPVNNILIRDSRVFGHGQRYTLEIERFQPGLKLARGAIFTTAGRNEKARMSPKSILITFDRNSHKLSLFRRS